ncbi:FAS1 domain-containing protein [Lophium mytilinum]|uniref:FAS1 domain-containing protein n=1 Tax=Lophium mytilinum TaxID=390894 RepID=A0A6A6QBB6_9PEZI|nr:FAS1 domain-containing protein [Lophium mytilinum]
MHRSPIYFLLSSALGANAKTFLKAISAYPQLSNFTVFAKANTAILPFSADAPLTVLVPDDNVFANNKQTYGVEVTSLPPTDLAPLFSYHLLVGALGGSNFTNPKIGSADRSSGQVLFVSSASSSGAKLRVRQGGSGTNPVKSGLDASVNMTIVNDGAFDGGNFHILDGILTLPASCSKTVRNSKLTALDNALNRTGIWPTLDHAQNITCLGPNNNAFSSAGNADSTLNVSALTNALLFHTIAQPLNSSFLTDGMEFTTLSINTVRVFIKGKDIYFNNAKVVDANLLANNGLMHVLDSVMLPLDQVNPSSSPTSSKPSPTGSATAAASSTGAAVIGVIKASGWSLLGILGAVVVWM